MTILYTDLIKRVPIFSTLTDEILSNLCLNLRPLPALKGAPVCIQGRIADCIYIVRSGRLQNWEVSNNVPMMARCTLSRADDAPHFWATVYDEMATDFLERAHLSSELLKLTLKSLIDQCKADGVDQHVIDQCMDSHSDPIPDLMAAMAACVEKASGGTIDIGGQETSKDLCHRSLDRKSTRITAVARHASNPPIGALPVRKRFWKRFWKNFDPSEGEATFRIDSRVKMGTTANVVEVRRGNVLGYLTEGDYAGEQTFLDSENVIRYPSNITAMEDTELWYLPKESLVVVKEAFPEVQSSIQNVLHLREKSERQRRMFSDAARGDDTLSITELHAGVLVRNPCPRLIIDGGDLIRCGSISFR